MKKKNFNEKHMRHVLEYDMCEILNHNIVNI